VIKHPGHTYGGFGSVFFLEPGYEKWYQSYIDCRTPA
jgi:hypothetical protein